MRYLESSDSQRQRVEWGLPRNWGSVFGGRGVSVEEEEVLEMDGGDFGFIEGD